MQPISVIPYTSQYREAFKQLNLAWIEKYFKIEEQDILTFQDPDAIIDNGGYIFVALYQEQPVGVCALKKVDDKMFEFSKMAVDEQHQGLGIGYQLITAAIEQARQTTATHLFLEGNTSLEASIHLYRKVGFKEVTTRSSNFERVNIIMELPLTNPV